MADCAPTTSIRAVGKKKGKPKYPNIKNGGGSVREPIC